MFVETKKCLWSWSSDEWDVKLVFPGPKNFMRCLMRQKKVFWSWNSEDVQHVFLTLFFGFCSFETNKADSSFLWWVGRQKPDGVTSTFLVSCLHYWLMTTVAHWRGCPFLSISANWSPCRMLTWRHTWGHTLHTMKIYKHSCSLKVEISQKFCKHSCSLSTCHHLFSPGACDSMFNMKLNMTTIPVFFVPNY